MKNILDKISQNKMLSFFIPIIISSLLYLIFVLFGIAEDKLNLIITTPISGVIWFFAVFLIEYTQIRNPRFSEKFSNIFDFLAIIVSAINSVILILSFVTSGFKEFDIVVCAAPLTISAISWAYRKRTKNKQ